jgi:hypothetical protein
MEFLSGYGLRSITDVRSQQFWSDSERSERVCRPLPVSDGEAERVWSERSER